MKVYIIEASYNEGKWNYTKKQTHLPKIEEDFKVTKNGYRYYYNPDEEDEPVAMDIFKSYIATWQKRKIKELYNSIEDLVRC